MEEREWKKKKKTEEKGFWGKRKEWVNSEKVL